MMGMSSPEWSRYLHGQLGVPRQPAGRFDRMRGAHLKIVLDFENGSRSGEIHAELKRSR
jgi:hypothetical protein